MGFITSFIIVWTSSVGIEAYGAVTAAISFIGIFTFISNLGLNTTHIKKVSEGKDEGKCLGVYFYLKTLATVLFVVISISAVITWKYVLGYGFETGSLEFLIYFAIVYYSIKSFIMVFIAHCYARSESAKVTIGEIIEFMVKDILIIGGIFLFLLPIDATLDNMAIFIMLVYLMSVVIKLFYHIYFSRKLKFIFLEKSLVREYIEFAKPLVLTTVGFSLIIYADVVMITYFGNLLDVGAYGLLKQLMFFVIQIGTIVSVVLLPLYSKQHANKESESVVIHILKAERLISLLLMPFIVGSVVLAPSICNIFKSDIVPYALTLQLLMIYSYIQVIDAPYKVQAVSLNKPYFKLKLVLFQLILNIFLNLIFIPQQLFGVNMLGMGANGAALGSMLSMVFATIYMRSFVWKNLGIFINKKIFYHILSGIISYLILYFIYSSYPVYSIFLVISYFFIGVGIYALITFLIKELKMDDINWLLHVFNPLEIIRYIKDEIKP